MRSPPAVSRRVIDVSWMSTTSKPPGSESPRLDVEQAAGRRGPSRSTPARPAPASTPCRRDGTRRRDAAARRAFRRRLDGAGDGAAPRRHRRRGAAAAERERVPVRTRRARLLFQSQPQLLGQGRDVRRRARCRADAGRSSRGPARASPAWLGCSRPPRANPRARPSAPTSATVRSCMPPILLTYREIRVTVHARRRLRPEPACGAPVALRV